jgi:hypothetical protein
MLSSARVGVPVASLSAVSPPYYSNLLRIPILKSKREHIALRRCDELRHVAHKAALEF